MVKWTSRRSVNPRNPTDPPTADQLRKSESNMSSDRVRPSTTNTKVPGTALLYFIPHRNFRVFASAKRSDHEILHEIIRLALDFGIFGNTRGRYNVSLRRHHPNLTQAPKDQLRCGSSPSTPLAQCHSRPSNPLVTKDRFTPTRSRVETPRAREALLKNPTSM